MGNHVYKSIELTGTSSSSIEEAVEEALKKASQSVRNMRWFETTSMRGNIQDGKIAQWQVTIKVGFTLDD